MDTKEKIHLNGNINNNNNIIKNDRGPRANFLCATEVTFCDDVSDDASSIGKASIISKNRTNLPLDEDNDDSDDSIDSSTSKSSRKPKIPDGGYGWIVVFASLMVSLIADGISFSFGLLYIEFLSYFQESKSKTAWIGSIFLAVPLLSGPIMSNLVDRYGCQKMTIIGGLLSGLGFLLAAFSNSIEVLYWTFGMIGGIGLGIGYVTAVVSIAFWFDKNRTFATGIGASGTGVGTFLYAPFTAWLIEVFGWRGCCIILAGTLFNICVFGALMREPDWLIENRLESRSQSIQTFSNSSVCLDEIKKLLEKGETNEMVLDTLLTNCNTEANQLITDPNNLLEAKKCRSVLLLPTYLEEYENYVGTKHGSWRSLRKNPPNEMTLNNQNYLQPMPYKGHNTISHKEPYKNTAQLASSETLATNEKYSNAEVESSLNNYLTELNDDGLFNRTLWQEQSNENVLNVSRLSLPSLSIRQPEDDVVRRSIRGNSLDVIYESSNGKTELTAIMPKNKKFYDISISMPNRNVSNNPKNRFYRPRGGGIVGDNLKRNMMLRHSNFLRDMRIHRHSIYYRGAMLNTHRYRMKASSCPNIYRNSMTTLARDNEEKWYDSFVDIMKSIFDFSLFLEPKFAAFNFSTLLLFIWFIVPYFYLPEYMLQHGFHEHHSSRIISGIGVSNTIGMIALGWLGDRPSVNIYKIFTFSLIVCGISCFLMPFVIESFLWLMILGLIFGVTFASSFSFTPIILVRLVDLDDFTCSYGLVLLVQGIGNLVGPPLSGLIYEWTEDWSWAFYTAGFWIAISGVFMYVTGYIEDREKLAKVSAESLNKKCNAIGK